MWWIDTRLSKAQPNREKKREMQCETAKRKNSLHKFCADHIYHHNSQFMFQISVFNSFPLSSFGQTFTYLLRFVPTKLNDIKNRKSPTQTQRMANRYMLKSQQTTTTTKNERNVKKVYVEGVRPFFRRVSFQPNEMRKIENRRYYTEQFKCWNVAMTSRVVD